MIKTIVAKMTLNIEIDEKDFEEMKKLEHHIENLLDLDSYPEIKSVFGVKIEKESEEERKIIIPFNEKYNLVAENLKDPEYPCEVGIFVEDKNGVFVQDLAIVQKPYTYSNGEPIFSDDSVNLLVFGDENSEDYTEKKNIKIYKGEK